MLLCRQLGVLIILTNWIRSWLIKHTEKKWSVIVYFIQFINASTLKTISTITNECILFSGSLSCSSLSSLNPAPGEKSFKME